MSIDVASGERTTLLDDSDHEYTGPRISPDGRTLAIVMMRREADDRGRRLWLALVDLDTGETRSLTADWDRWPGRPVWTPDGSALIVSADEGGSSPLFRVDAATGAVRRLTGDHGAYTDAQVSPDGRYVYAMRSAIDAPPAPVRIDASRADQQPEFLRGPAERPACRAR